MSRNLVYKMCIFKRFFSRGIVDLTDPNAMGISKEEFLSSKIDVDRLKPHEYRALISKSEDVKRVIHSQVIKFRRPLVKELSEESQKLMYQDKGVYKMNRQEYYKQFFNKDGKNINSEYQKYYRLLKKPPRIKERRIRSSKYWYKSDYTSPSFEEISKLTPNELKFTLMNQARFCRFNKSIDNDTWDMLLDRILKISKKIKLRTLIRYLQAISNVQIMNWKVRQLIELIYSKRIEMKPKHYIYLFQALGRLRYQGLNLFEDLHEMMLCWSILRNNFLIKAANSLSKLGLGGDLLALPLQKTISHRIATFTGSDCIKVKSIACLELFTDEMLIAFLHKCDYNRTLFCHYTRHLEIIELYLRLCKPNIYNKLNDATKEFLISSREFSKLKKKVIQDDDDMDDHNKFICDVSNHLSELGIDTKSGVIAGPFILDLYNSEMNLVIECCSPYQYYIDTGVYTTSALWRHKLISAMGFKLILIPQNKWNSLKQDNDKGVFLLSLLKYNFGFRFISTSRTWHAKPKKPVTNQEDISSTHLFNIYQNIPEDHELLPDRYYPNWLWELDTVDKSYGELVLIFMHGRGIDNATIYDYMRFRRLHNKCTIRMNNIRLQKRRKLSVKSHFYD